jgi:hypothetical protein
MITGENKTVATGYACDGMEQELMNTPLQPIYTLLIHDLKP